MNVIKSVLILIISQLFLFKSANAQIVPPPTDFSVHTKEIVIVQNQPEPQWVLDSIAAIPLVVNPPSTQTFTQAQQDSANASILPSLIPPTSTPSLTQHQIDSMEMIGVNDTLKYVVVISLADTTNISKVHLKLGISNGGMELYNGEFFFSGIQNLPPHIHYTRTGNLLHIELQTRRYDIFSNYGEVQIEDNLGNLSTPLTYQFN